MHVGGIGGAQILKKLAHGRNAIGKRIATKFARRRERGPRVTMNVGAATLKKPKPDEQERETIIGLIVLRSHCETEFVRRKIRKKHKRGTNAKRDLKNSHVI